MGTQLAPHHEHVRAFRIPAGRVRARFGKVVDPGFQPVPDVLLFHQSDLKLSSEELNVLLNLMAHWHEPKRMPFPRTATIVRRMGVSERTVQRLLSCCASEALSPRLWDKTRMARKLTIYNH
jgi:predicted solute-binding protein